MLVALLLAIWLTALVKEAETDRLREGRATETDFEGYASSKYIHIDVLLVLNCSVPAVLAIVQLAFEYRTETEYARSLVGHHNYAAAVHKERLGRP